MAAVDSVVCQQPKMELQNDVVQLSKEQCDFVVRADSTTILFRSDTPYGLLPARGKVVLAMNADRLPALQFAGRVLDIQRKAEGIFVTCDPNLQMQDIFRRLTAVMFTSPPARGKIKDEYEEDWNGKVPHSGNREKFDPFSKDFIWVPSTKSYTNEKGEKVNYTPNYVSGFQKTLDPLKVNLLDKVEDKPAILASDDNNVGVSLTCHLNYRQKFVIDFFKDDNDWLIPSLYLYWRPTFLPVIDGTANVTINAEWSKEIKCFPDVPSIGIWTPPVPPAIPPIRIGEVNFHVTQFYVQIGGKTDISYNFEAKKIFDVELERSPSGGTKVYDMTKKENGGYTDQSGLYGKGFSFGESELGDDFENIASAYIWLAWKPSVGLSLINEKVLTAKLELKVGPWVQINIEKTKEEPADEYTRFYQKWSPSHLLTKLHLETDFKVTFAGDKDLFSLKETLANWHISDGKGWDFMVHRYGVFPGFGAPQLSPGWNQSLNERGVLSLTTPYKNPNHGTPARDKIDRTLLAADLGLGMYKVHGDGTQEEVAVSFKPKKEKGWFNKEEGTYTTEFKNVKRGVFKIAPVFDAAFFSPHRALPEIDVVVPASVVTEDVTSVGQHHCFMNGYTLGLKEFNSVMGGGKATMGWILKKADEGDNNSNSLTINNADEKNKEPITEDNTVNETVNGEDKLSFGPSHDKSKEMEKLTRCDNLRPATTYVYRAWAASINDKMEESVVYGEIKEFTTQASDKEPRCEVDLGLSVIWACYNVGASKEYQYGDYFAWGEKATKKEYTAAKYKLPSKHNIAGDTEYDVATTWNVGENSGWRMPTKAEIQELIDNCKMEWITVHKVKGMKFTSKKNGASIFLPAAGNKYAKKTYSHGVGGCYWSGDLDEESLKVTVTNATIGEIELDEDDDENVEDEEEEGIGEGNARELTAEEKADAWRLHFNNVGEEGKAPHNEAGRCFYGRTIRPVREKPKEEPVQE